MPGLSLNIVKSKKGTLYKFLIHATWDPTSSACPLVFPVDPWALPACLTQRLSGSSHPPGQPAAVWGGLQLWSAHSPEGALTWPVRQAKKVCGHLEWYVDDLNTLLKYLVHLVLLHPTVIIWSLTHQLYIKAFKSWNEFSWYIIALLCSVVKPYLFRELVL